MGHEGFYEERYQRGELKEVPRWVLAVVVAFLVFVSVFGDRIVRARMTEEARVEHDRLVEEVRTAEWGAVALGKEGSACGFFIGEDAYGMRIEKPGDSHIRSFRPERFPHWLTDVVNHDDERYGEKLAELFTKKPNGNGC